MILMNEQKTFLIILLMTGLIISAFPVFPIQVEGANPSSGGTDGDNPWIDGHPWGGEKWRTLYGFVMVEGSEKVEETFNVTICGDVKQDKDTREYYAVEPIYGELKDIQWADEEEFTITQQQFDEHKEDLINLTVYILGDYYRENPGSGQNELRQAYKDVQIQRPNHAPKAIARISNSDLDGNNLENWTQIESNEDPEVIYYIDSEGIQVKFYFDANSSTDEDDDDITGFYWDLDGDNAFGAYKEEQKEYPVVYLGEGDHLLGLRVSDGDMESKILDIKIIIKLPIRYPDLTIQDLQVVNKNGEEDIIKDDRAGVLAHVKNIGDNATRADLDFDVYFEYWYRDGSPEEPDWRELGTVTVSETIGVNGLKLVEAPWDTGNPDFLPGIYSFKATVDYSDTMKELREKNNVFPAEEDEMEAENITLQDGGDSGEPTISIVDVVPSKTDAWVNELVYINITLKNTGTGNARYVDIYYYVDNSFQYYKTIDSLPNDGQPVAESFVFSGDTNNTYKIKLEVRDDGEVKKTSDTFTILVSGGGGGGGGPGPDTGGGEDDSGLNENVPIIILAVVIVGGLGGSGFFFMKKKDEDVW
jgi:hypothetical protein